MKQVIAFLTILLLTGCAAGRKAGQQSASRDSTRVEVRIEKITKTDTVYIDIPKIIEKNVTKEDHSFLENEYAKSEASIDSTGMLHHSLETKAQKKPVPVQTESERRDSIIYKDREVKVEKPIYIEKELTWVQQAQIYGFRVMVAIAALWALIKYRKKITTFVRKII